MLQCPLFRDINMGFATLWMLCKNLLKLPTLVVAQASGAEDAGDKRAVVYDYWIGRLLCTLCLGAMYMLLSDLLSWIELVDHEWVPKPGFAPYLFVILILLWYVLSLGVEFTHGTSLNAIPGQPPRFFLFGHSHIAIRQFMLRCWDGANRKGHDDSQNGIFHIPSAAMGGNAGVNVFWKSAWNPVVTLWSANMIKAVLQVGEDTVTLPRSGPLCPFSNVREMVGSTSLMDKHGELWNMDRPFLEKPFLALRDAHATVLCSTRSELIRLMREVCKNGDYLGWTSISLVLRLVLFDALCKIMFGPSFKSNEDLRASFFAALETKPRVDSGVFSQFKNAWCLRRCTQSGRDFISASGALRGNIENIVSQFCARKPENLEEARNYVYTLLMAETEIESWTRKNTVDNIVGALYHAFECTVAAMEWITVDIFCAGKLVQKRIASDAKRMTDKNEIGNAKCLNYLRSCIKESLRLHPPVPAFSRYVNKDIKVGTYTIPANTNVVISTYMLHRNPSAWGVKNTITAKLNEYDPLRHASDSMASTTTAFSYLPFGGGRRGCLAPLISQSILEQLVQTLFAYFEIFECGVEGPIPMLYDGTFCRPDGDVLEKRIGLRRRR